MYDVYGTDYVLCRLQTSGQHETNTPAAHAVGLDGVRLDSVGLGYLAFTHTCTSRLSESVGSWAVQFARRNAKWHVTSHRGVITMNLDKEFRTVRVKVGTSTKLRLG